MATRGGDLTLDEVRAEAHGWRVWRTTDAGTWWATRRGPDWKAEPRTLAADSGAELLELMRAAAKTDAR